MPSPKGMGKDIWISLDRNAENKCTKLYLERECLSTL